jgi:hypothetical protein
MSRPVRTVAYLVVLLLAAVWLAERHPPPPLAPTPGTERDVTVERMEETLASLRASLTSNPDTVIVLGDSSFLDHFVLKREQTLAFLLEAEAPQAALSVRVVAYSGFDAVAYYLLADEIAALHPRAVVLTANLQALTDSWFRNPRMKHPQLTAFVRPTRVPEAMGLPLDLAGISDLSLATMPMLRLFGATEVPEILEGYRERFRGDIDRLLGLWWAAMTEGGPGTAAAAALDRPRSEDAAVLAIAAGPPTAGAPRQRRRGKGLAPGTWLTSPFRRLDLYPDHLGREQASVRVLGASVRDLVARGVRTVVLIAPLHLQALQLTGAYQRRDITGAVALIRDVTVENGATPLDLTEALPQEIYFTDAHTHFTVEGNRIVVAQILAELRRVLTRTGS